MTLEVDTDIQRCCVQNKISAGMDGICIGQFPLRSAYKHCRLVFRLLYFYSWSIFFVIINTTSAKHTLRGIHKRS